MTAYPKVMIHDEDDHERVTLRIDELARAAIGSREEAELLALLEAVERWELRREDRADWF